MAATVIRQETAEDGTTRVMLDCEGTRWQLHIKPVRDFNNRISGYHFWLHPHGMAFETEQDAISAALAVIDRIVGSNLGIDDVSRDEVSKND